MNTLIVVPVPIPEIDWGGGVAVTSKQMYKYIDNHIVLTSKQNQTVGV